MIPSPQQPLWIFTPCLTFVENYINPPFIMITCKRITSEHHTTPTDTGETMYTHVIRMKRAGRILIMLRNNRQRFHDPSPSCALPPSTTVNEHPPVAWPLEDLHQPPFMNTHAWEIHTWVTCCGWTHSSIHSAWRSWKFRVPKEKNNKCTWMDEWSTDTCRGSIRLLEKTITTPYINLVGSFFHLPLPK